MILGICSDLMGAGKDFTADHLVKTLPYAKKYSFASTLKDIIYEIFGLHIDQLPSEEKAIEKDLALPDVDRFQRGVAALMSGWRYAYIIQNGQGVASRIVDKTSPRAILTLANALRYELVNNFTIDGQEGIYVSPRRLMTFIGTDFFRKKVHDSFWSTLLHSKIMQERQHTLYHIISDVRFANEAMITDKLIYIESPTNPNQGDARHAHNESEKWIPHNPDYHLINRYDDEFINDIEGVACQLLERE